MRRMETIAPKKDPLNFTEANKRKHSDLTLTKYIIKADDNEIVKLSSATNFSK